MWKLVRLQFQSNIKTDLLILVLFVGYLIFFTNLNFIPLLMALLIVRVSNKGDRIMLKALITMPVERQHIVQARYIYEAIIYSLMFIIPGTISYFKKPAELVTVVAIITVYVIIFNVFFAQSIANEFSAKPASLGDVIIFILPAIGLFLIHVILIAISDARSWWLLMLPIPVISFIMLRYYYKRSIEQLRLKEFI